MADPTAFFDDHRGGLDGHYGRTNAVLCDRTNRDTANVRPVLLAGTYGWHRTAAGRSLA